MCVQISDPAFKVEISFRTYRVKSKDIAASTACPANQNAEFIRDNCSLRYYRIRQLLAQLRIGLNLPNLKQPLYFVRPVHLLP